MRNVSGDVSNVQEEDLDALEALTRSLIRASNNVAATPVTRQAIDPANRQLNLLGPQLDKFIVVPRPSIQAHGKTPNILSTKARKELIKDVQKIAWWALCAAIGIAIIVPVIDLLSSQEISALWVVPVVTLIFFSLFLYILSYFTVMGFGEVELRLDFGKDDKDEGNEESKEKTEDDQKQTKNDSKDQVESKE